MLGACSAISAAMKNRQAKKSSSTNNLQLTPNQMSLQYSERDAYRLAEWLADNPNVLYMFMLTARACGMEDWMPCDGAGDDD